MNPIDPPAKTQSGPGCLMLAAILVGTVVGMRNHQPSAGILAGAGAAVLVAFAMWFLARRR